MEVLDTRWCAPLAPVEMQDALRGRTVKSLGRRGKYLVWHLSGEMHLAQHLRMTGTVLCDPKPEPSHVRVRMELVRPRRRPNGGVPGPADGVRGPAVVGLAVCDPRRFGTGELLLGSDALEEFFAVRLGLEPLDERFTVGHLRELARGRGAPVKAFVLDQRRMAGVGNIYADEALHRARIHPLQPVSALSGEQLERLREALVWALREGIDARGATIDDFRHVDGVWGSFQDRFKVHRRAGEPCERCGTAVVKLRVAGRGTYVCETCQPPPASTRSQSVPGVRRRAARPSARSPQRPASRRSLPPASRPPAPGGRSSSP